MFLTKVSYIKYTACISLIANISFIANTNNLLSYDGIIFEWKHIISSQSPKSRSNYTANLSADSRRSKFFVFMANGILVQSLSNSLLNVCYRGKRNTAYAEF